MLKPTFRNTRLILVLGLVVALLACAQNPSTPVTPAPQIGNGYPENLDIREPGEREVVVVINDNMQMVHAGMFAAGKLLDPAGSYLGVRTPDSSWKGVSLQDYVRFQLEDGPFVKMYRFSLPPDAFIQIKERVENAGVTVPLFCAARVQNILSGVAPFGSVPNTWLASPAALASHLDLIVGKGAAGSCYWPNGTSCDPLVFSAGAGVAGR